MGSKPVAVFILCACMCMLWLESADSSIVTRRGLKDSSLSPSTRAEKERDFLDWVRRVGLKNQSSTTLTIQTAAETSAVAGNVITVDKTGKGEFTTVQAAVNAVPTNNQQRIVIQIAAGVYEEKVNVPETKPFVTFQGAGSGVTTIVWHDTASSSGSTRNSASVAIDSDNFIARGISFKNSAPAPPPGAVGRQAVALRISGDKAAFYSCNFYGAQDTLYDYQGRHYFENCFIEGSIDFIFGDGLSLYKGCTLHAIATSSGSLTAQKRSSPGDDTGFSFINCKVTGSGMLYLGRAWGPYSRVVFSYTFLDDIIIPEGWNNWGDTSREKTVVYGQYKCSGPGADQKGRVAWSHELTDTQAAPFLSLSFIDGASWVQT